ncbi:hypothetical protein [Clostridium sp. Cult2]|uniref:hypothetical protein n=1 Tax=Clostridium sp. Cult2 TaxID=2079003 RepID=UPI001F4490CA|nr:hypothetical protein [Clostridium sp. Cult2]MCF6466055.1 hypothetical protein [Clostridium sp. Cult2]
MKDFRILKVLDRFKGLFERLGIDYYIMRRILQVKLTLDGRRTPTTMINSSKKKKDEDNSFIKSLWIYILLGIIFIPLVIAGENYLFQMSLVFGIIMFMMVITLISDFSSVLLDLKDKDIILSKPIDGRTLSAAKTIHIMIYMFFITFSFIGPGLIAGLVKHGFLFFIIFFIEIIFMDLFIVVLTALLYLLILKIFDGEKLKDIINYFQIALTITVTIGYQLVGRLFNINVFLNQEFTPKPWHYIIPPIWFGGPFELILKKNLDSYIIIFSTLAFIIPIISMIIYNKLTPTFEHNLQKLNDSSGTSKPRNKGFNKMLSELVCRTKEEATFFRFATNMMKKERNFKLRVYPSLGFSLIFPFIFLLAGLKEAGLEGITSSKAYFSIYFIGFLVPNIVSTIGFSGNYKGAWVYKIAPFNETKTIFKGTIKASLISLILPLYIFISTIYMIIFRGKIFIDLVVLLLALLLFIIICFNLTTKRLPFSEPFEEVNKGEGIMAIFYVLILGLLAGAHYIATMFKYGMLIYILALILINIFAWRKGFNVELEGC